MDFVTYREVLYLENKPFTNTFRDIFNAVIGSFPFTENPCFQKTNRNLVSGGAEKNNMANTKARKRPGPLPILCNGNIFKCFVKITFKNHSIAY